VRLEAHTRAQSCSKNSAGETPSASASAAMLSSPMLRWPRSTLDTYVRWMPASSASCSCENPRCSRIRRTRRPNATRAGCAPSRVCFVIMDHDGKAEDDYEATDYE
jgi:hypothetical protein